MLCPDAVASYWDSNDEVRWAFANKNSNYFKGGAENRACNAWVQNNVAGYCDKTHDDDLSVHREKCPRVGRGKFVSRDMLGARRGGDEALVWQHG